MAGSRWTRNGGRLPELISYGCVGKTTGTQTRGDRRPDADLDADNGAALCTYTLLCRDGDAHPSDAGYAVLADLAEEALT